MTRDRRQAMWIVGAAVAGLLIYAWIDGGEQPLAPIVVPVEVPVTAR